MRRLGIPFGIYHYSYAYDVNFAVQEGQWVVQLLRKYGVNPSDMALPVFYDVEQGDWGGHRMPTNANAFRPIINAFVNQLASAGYGRTYLYTYLNYAVGTPTFVVGSTPRSTASRESAATWI